MVNRLRTVLVLLAACGTALAGENVWTTSGPPGAISALAVDPNDGSVYSGARVGNRSFGFRSLDHGQSWTIVGEAPENASIPALAADPLHPGTVYAATAAHLDGNLFRSPDSGASWSRLADLEGWIVHSLRVQRPDPSLLYGAIDVCRCIRVPCFPSGTECRSAVLKSEDRGATSRRIEAGLAGSTLTALELDPFDSNRLFAGGNAGAFISIDAGETWSSSNVGLETCSPVTAIAAHPNEEGLLYAASAQYGFDRLQCGGVFASRDGGRNWAATALRDVNVTALALDPSNPERLYVGAAKRGSGYPEGGVFRSTDGGATWERLGSGLPESGVVALVIEPSGGILHAGTAIGVFDYEIVPGARPPALPPRNRQTRVLPSRP